MFRTNPFAKLSVLIAMLFTTPAFAGGGPPQTFNDLAYLADHVIGDRISDFEATGQIPEWYENECSFWSSLVDNIGFYFESETIFRAKATQKATANAWKIKLAKATGEGLELIPTYKLRRLQAQQQLAQMNAWRTQFIEYKAYTALSQKYYWCSAEQMCVQPEPEPEPFGTVNVQKNWVTQQLVYGVHRHLFSFTLNMGPEEDGEFQQVSFSLILSGNQSYDHISDCTLENNAPGVPGPVVGTQPYVYYDSNNEVGILVFDLSPGVIIPKGTSEQFNLFCALTPQFDPYSALQVGFIPTLGTGPANAIKVIGLSSAQVLQVGPDMDMQTVLTN